MELNYKAFGDGGGDPLLILHGMFGTLDNWQTIAKQLGEHFLVFALDLRNHGRSPHSPEFGYEVMAQDVRNFIDEHGLRQPHIIGHSMGGKVAMRVALDSPAYVDRLVVVDIAPKAYSGHHDEVFRALFAVQPDQLASRAEAEAILKSHLDDQGTIQFILKNLIISKETGRYAWRMNLPVIYAAYAEILGHEPSRARFLGETLFVRGERSNYIEPAEFESFKTNFPRAELATVPQAGHWVHADQPQAFLETVLQFLQR